MVAVFTPEDAKQGLRRAVAERMRFNWPSPGMMMVEPMTSAIVVAAGLPGKTAGPVMVALPAVTVTAAVKGALTFLEAGTGILLDGARLWYSAMASVAASRISVAWSGGRS